MERARSWSLLKLGSILSDDELIYRLQLVDASI